ncbi:MAG: response regulator [Parvularculaceae bacterium]|nr:response regulator [Parvularculaceae bacterium]
MVSALAAGAGVVALIFFLFAYFYDLKERSLRSQEIENYMSSVGEATAWGVNNWLDERIKLAEGVAYALSKEDDETDHVESLKSPIYERAFIWTYYGETDGAYHIWPPDDEMPADYDPRTRPWYHDAVAAGAPTLTEPYYDISTKVETITVAAPVFDNGVLQGVVGADFSTQTLSSVLMATDLGGLGYAFLVTADGKVLAHPDRNVVDKTLSDIFPASTPEISEKQQFVKTANGPQIVSFAQIPTLGGLDWRLGVAIDQNKAFASLDDFRNSTLIATLSAIALMVVVLGFVIHRLLVQPLMKARIAADAANAAKSEFLASMSHEIRTPMNGVLGMAEVLLKTNLDQRQHELASIIVSSGSALMTVINDILDFSKLEAGKLKLSPHSFNLRQMVYEVSTMMQARALEKDIELIVRYAPNLPEGVIADDSRLRQVLGNLIGNAVKFTDTGHVLVEVTGVRRGGVVNLRISVIDTGIGIAPDQIPRMFEKFEQADASHTRRFGGTGLGLAICRNIVELMGGEIHAESVVDSGSIFWFNVTLPADDKIKAMPTIDNAAFDGARLLAVDDNRVNRRIFEELMSAWSLRATIVASAAEAFSALEKSVAENDRYHVILMDYQMPGEDGFTLTKRIQSDHRFSQIPVVMLSSVDYAVPTDSDGAAFVANIAKPVRPSQLMDLLARILIDTSALEMERTADTMRATPPKDLQHEKFRHDRPKLLVAEDNIVNQMVVKNLIPETEYEVILAANGADAVEMFAKHHPAAILMDLSMPVMDGLEATRQIRRIEAERGLVRTPIIAATAHVLEEDRDRCRLAGMDDFIAKPIRKPMLDQALIRWVAEVIEWDDAANA